MFPSAELEACGPYEVEYEGMGTTTWSANMWGSGPFVIRQLRTGAILVWWLFAGGRGTGFNEQPRGFRGVTLAGEQIKCGPLLGRRHTFRSSGYQTYLWYTPWVQAKEIIRGANATRVKQILRRRKQTWTFVLANWLFPVGNQEIQSEAEDWRFTLGPSPAYQDFERSLRYGGGYAATAICKLEDLGKTPRPQRKAHDFADNLCMALSLASGTLVSWMYQEQEGIFKTSRYHRESIIHPYSSFLSNVLRFQPNPSEVLSNWFDGRPWPTDGERTRFVRHFLEACSTDQFLETRGMLAATFLDAITASYARETSASYLFDEHGFEKEWRNIRAAIEQTLNQRLQNPSKQRAKRMARNARRIYRSSFGDRLDALFDKLQLPNQRVRKIVEIRNNLIHEGLFPSEDHASKLKELRVLLWAGYAALLKATGCPGEIPLIESS